MTKIQTYKQQMIARKAAAAGMSVEDFLAHAEREADRQRFINLILTDRDLQWRIIDRHALNNNRSFHKLT